MAVEPEPHQVMRQLVDRGRRVTVAGTQQAKQLFLVGQHAVVVHRRVAEIRANGVNTVFLNSRRQRFRRQVQRLGPFNLDMLEYPDLRADALEGFAQAVRIFVNIHQ